MIRTRSTPNCSSSICSSTFPVIDFTISSLPNAWIRCAEKRYLLMVHAQAEGFAVDPARIELVVNADRKAEQAMWTFAQGDKVG